MAKKTAEQAAQQVAEIIRRAELRAQAENEVVVMTTDDGGLSIVITQEHCKPEVLWLTEAQALVLEVKLQDMFRMGAK